MKRLISAAMICVLPGLALADPCAPYLNQLVASYKAGGYTMKLDAVTLDGGQPVAQFAPQGTFFETELGVDAPSYLFPNAVVDFSTGKDEANQLFSARMISDQPFDVKVPNKLRIKITNAAAPVVTLTQMSYYKAPYTSFAVDCAANGVMHATVGQTDYLLHLYLVSAPLPIQ